MGPVLRHFPEVEAFFLSPPCTSIIWVRPSSTPQNGAGCSPSDISETCTCPENSDTLVACKLLDGADPLAEAEELESSG